MINDMGRVSFLRGFDNLMKYKCDVDRLGEYSTSGTRVGTASSTMEDSPVSRSYDNSPPDAWFESLANLLTEIVYKTDEEGMIIFLNQEGMQAFFPSTPELTGKIRPEMMFAQEERERMRCTLKRCLDGIPEEPAEYKVLTKEGRIHPVLVQGKPVFKNGGCAGSIWLVTGFAWRREHPAWDKTPEETALWENPEYAQMEKALHRASISERCQFGDIIGKSLPMQEVYEFIIKAAFNPANVIIYGE
jgi:PAS domain S-box-containing protein